MRKARKRIFSLLVVTTLLLTWFTPLTASAAYDQEVEFTSDIVYMENLDTGTVIFNKNTEKQTAMASLTKIATAIIVLENVDDLSKEITVSQTAMDTLANTNSSTSGITVGEVLTVEQLLNLMLVHSGNDAAAVLAESTAGSIPKFVQMMNTFAEKIGMEHTSFANPHGLDADNHYTTAEDLVILTKYALKNDTFKNIVAQSSYTLADTNKRDSITYQNTNLLMSKSSTYYFEPVKGIKTGTTEKAGHCLISYATQNGYTYLCVILSGEEAYANSNGTNTAFEDTLKAYNWVFDNLKLKVVAKPTDVITVANIDLARKVDTVQLVPTEEVTALLPSGVDASGVSIEVVEGSIDSDLRAPVKIGDVVGKATVLYAGSELCTIDLTVAEDVNRSFFGTIAYLIQTLFQFTAAKIVFAILLLSLVLWLVINYLYRKKQREERVNMVRLSKKYHSVDHLENRNIRSSSTPVRPKAKTSGTTTGKKKNAKKSAKKSAQTKKRRR